jgi:hypothetical protein
LAAVDSVVTTLRDLQVVRRLAIGLQVTNPNLTSFGLDRPRSAWQIESDGALYNLNVGANAPPPRGGTYVELVGPSPNSHQFLVVNGDTSRLTLPPEILLESRLLPYVPSDVGQLGIDSNRNHSTYQFDAARARWFEATGQHRRISREKIEKLLFSLTNLKSEHFLSRPDDDRFKTATAIAAMSLELAKTRGKVVVQFYGTCGKWPELSTVRISGATSVAACVNAQDLTNTLGDEAPSWLDDRLFSVRTDEIEGLTIKLEGHSLELEREEMGFVTGGPEPHRIDIDAGNDSLQTLTSIRGVLANSASEIAQADVGPSNYIEVRSAVVGATDRYEERVLIGPAQANGQRWVKRVTDSTLLRLDAKAADSLRIESKLMGPQPSSSDRR